MKGLLFPLLSVLAVSWAAPNRCQPGQLLPDPLDCGAFRWCSAGHTVPLSCPRGLHFSPRLRRCTLPVFARCAPVNGVAVDNAAIKSNVLEIIQTFIKGKEVKQLPETKPHELNKAILPGEQHKEIVELQQFTEDVEALPKVPTSDETNDHLDKTDVELPSDKDISKEVSQKIPDNDIKEITESEADPVNKEEEAESNNTDRENVFHEEKEGKSGVEHETLAEEEEMDNESSKNVDEEEEVVKDLSKDGEEKEAAESSAIEEEKGDTGMKEQQQVEEEEANDQKEAGKELDEEEKAESNPSEEKNRGEMDLDVENQEPEASDEGGEKKKDAIIVKKKDEEEDDESKHKSGVVKKSEEEKEEGKEQEKDDDSGSDSEEEE